MERRSALRHESEVLSIVDVCCREHRGGCGREENAGGDAIVLPRAGFFVWHVRGDEVVAETGRALFFGRGESYRVSHPLAGGDDCTVLAFTPSSLAEAFNTRDPTLRDPPVRPFPAASCATSPAVALLQQGLRRLLRREAATESDHAGSAIAGWAIAGMSIDGLAIDELALRLLDLVARAASSAFADSDSKQATSSRPRRRARADTIRAHRELADAARRLLAATFHEHHSLADLASHLHCSPFHLARVFRACAGEPIHRHRLRLRLHAALEQLADGEDDLTRLALSLGFASHAHLTDSFRRRFGLAPARFRDGLTPARLREMSRILEAAAPCAA